MANRYQQLVGLLGNNTSPLPTEGNGLAWKPILYNIGLITFFLFLVLLFIHYTYRPIFSFSPEDDGILPINRVTDLQITWKEPPAPEERAILTDSISTGFTVGLDIYVGSNFSFSQTKRVILYRSRAAVHPPNESRRDYAAIYPGTNFLIFFEEDTNDLVVMIFTQDSANRIEYESAPTVYNVPLKQFFRVVMVLLPTYLEVYINGKLVSTKALKNQPISSASSFFSTPEIFRPGVIVQNLQYWPRPLSALEVAKISTALPENPKSDISEAVCA
jgi:hypothetical protein